MSEEDQRAQEICKYYQTGYCKHGIYRKKDHIHETCQIAICREANWKKRPPRTCKYFAKNMCKKSTYCAYSHTIKNYSRVNIAEEVQSLKAEIEELKQSYRENTQKLKDQVKELSNNMSEMIF